MRFAISPPWRFVVTDLDTAVLTFLDRLASGRSLDYHLYAPATASMRVPSESPEVNILHTDGRPFVANNDRLLYGFRRDGMDDDPPWTVRFAGIVSQLNDVGDSERALTTIRAFDPWQYLFQRPIVVDESGTFPTVDGYTFPNDDTPTANPAVIAATLLSNSIGSHGTVRIDAGILYEGTIFWGGTIAGALPDVDVTFERGETVGEGWQKLIDTGAIDIVLTPIFDPADRPGYLADLSVVAQAGSTRNDAIFSWDQPSLSLTGIDRLVDGAQLANRFQYYSGQGGIAVSNILSSFPTAEDLASIAQYGEYWATQAFPTGTAAADLLAVRARANAQLLLRKQGKTTVTTTPAPERSPDPFNEYWLGDRVPIYASNRLRDPIPSFTFPAGLVEASIGAYEGNPSPCPSSPGSGLYSRMPESTGPVRYVDFTSGNDSNNGLTPSTPWLTLKGVSYHSMQPGWIFYCTGTYTPSGSPRFADTHPGDATNPITFMRWPGQPRPTLSITDANFIGDASAFYWRFRDFDITLSNNLTINNYASWFEFDGCTITHALGSGYIDTYGPDQTYIGCTFRNSGFPGRYTLLESYGGSLVPGGGDRLSVLNCLFADVTGAIGWVALFGSTGCIIANNTFANSDYNSGAIELWNAASGTVIANNIFSGLAGPAIHDDFHIGPPIGTLNLATHNLFWDLVGPPIVDDNTPAEIIDGDSNVTSNPLFVAAGSGNYSLQSGSPADNASSPTYVPADDIVGANRPTDPCRDYQRVYGVTLDVSDEGLESPNLLVSVEG